MDLFLTANVTEKFCEVRNGGHKPASNLEGLAGGIFYSLIGILFGKKLHVNKKERPPI